MATSVRPSAELNPEQAQLVRRLLHEGESVRDLAKTFDVHIATIYRLAETRA
jgi:transposase